MHTVGAEGVRKFTINKASYNISPTFKRLLPVRNLAAGIHPYIYPAFSSS